MSTVGSGRLRATPSLASTIFACEPHPSSKMGPTMKPPCRRGKTAAGWSRIFGAALTGSSGNSRLSITCSRMPLRIAAVFTVRWMARRPPIPFSVKPKLSSIAGEKEMPITRTMENWSVVMRPMA
jgi:hypothetical protein